MKTSRFIDSTALASAIACVLISGSGCMYIRGTALTPSLNSTANSVTAPVADHLVLIDGDAQNASAGTAVTTQPKVQVIDSNGDPISGVVLTFTVTGGGGNVGSATVTSDASGYAETSFTLGAAAGANTMVVARQGTALPGAPSTITFTETSKLVNLEVPITMLGKGLSSDTGASTTFSRTQTQLTTTDYDGTVTYSFEVVAENSDAANKNVEIVDSAGVSKGSVTVSNGVSPTRYRGVFTPNAGADVYRVKLAGTTSDDQLIVHTARMIVKQVGATKTRIYIPLLQAVRVGNPASYSKLDLFCSSAHCYNNTSYVLNTPGLGEDIIWAKDSSVWKTLSGATPWTFELTLNDPLGTGKVSLINNTTSARVTATEITEANTASGFTHKTVDFADNATNFTNGSEFSVRSMDAAGNYVAVDHAGLWVKLDHLQQGEVYYPVSTYAFYLAGNVTQQRVLYDGSLFSNPLAYFEGNGFGDLDDEVELEDHGTNDSGSGGLIPVASAALHFVSVDKTRQRSAALTLTNGNRYIMASGGAGGGNGSLVVGFSW